MDKKRTLLAVGNDDLEGELRDCAELEIVDSDPDIDVITDILDYIDAIDLVIVNTLLSQNKSYRLAEKAEERGVKVIALTDDNSCDSNFIAKMAGTGVYAFVPVSKITQVRNIALDYPMKFDFSVLQPLAPKDAVSGGEVRAPVEHLFVNKVTVAVLGSMNRIGTTTQAVGMVSALNRAGFDACYIEANKKGFISSIMDIYTDVESDLKAGKVTYEGMDMFFQAPDFASILKLPYLFYVYDYGDIGSADSLSWAEKDMLVVCCGSKPQELGRLQAAQRALGKKDAKYIFSFSSEKDRDGISSVMGNQAGDIYFAGYTPDPFSEPDTFYLSLLSLGEHHSGGEGMRRRMVSGSKFEIFRRRRRV